MRSPTPFCACAAQRQREDKHRKRDEDVRKEGGRDGRELDGGVEVGEVDEGLDEARGEDGGEDGEEEVEVVATEEAVELGEDGEQAGGRGEEAEVVETLLAGGDDVGVLDLAVDREPWSERGSNY